MAPKQVHEAIIALRPLIEKMASTAIRKLSANVEKKDLVQAATERLLLALPRFDPKMGNLEGFARPCIRGAFLDELRCFDVLTRSDRHAINTIEKTRRHLAQCLGREPTNAEIRLACDFSYEEFYELLSLGAATGRASAEDDAEDDADKVVDKSSGALNSSVEQAVWQKECLERFSRFAATKLSEQEQAVLAGYIDGTPTKVIGRQRGCSESRASQIFRSAVARVEQRSRW